MATIIEHPNSIWPNGLKVDSEGYVTFYPLGTNKVDISTITWPDGDTLISPYVYKNGKLVNFCDTNSMLNDDINATITLPYKEVDAIFSSELLSIIKPTDDNEVFKVRFEKNTVFKRWYIIR